MQNAGRIIRRFARGFTGTMCSGYNLPTLSHGEAETAAEVMKMGI